MAVGNIIFQLAKGVTSCAFFACGVYGLYISGKLYYNAYKVFTNKD